MLFSSAEFLFLFLPLTLLAFHLLRIYQGGRAAMAATVAASLFFYGWWNPPYLLLIITSIGGNFFYTRALATNPGRWKLLSALGFNLALLGYFKYRNFFLENVDYLIGDGLTEPGSLGVIFIPLGISFYTFQQMALLLDANDGAVKKTPDLLEYSQFILFFPQLIAGPIILYREMVDQFTRLEANHGAGLSLFGPGLVVFTLGLFKKVCLADGIAQFANLAFSSHASITMLEAWAGILAYSLQLYFDFSGYSDMAVGLGLMFGFCLPLNFDTPFRARNMIDFWKRWHMTMTRFFMMYVYSPMALSLSRYGLKHLSHAGMIFILAVACPIMVTFLLSGLWHGAGWTFVIFGAVNGLGLITNHAWKEWGKIRLPFILSWALTLLTVLVSFVYFRAENLVVAHNILEAMFSPAAFLLPNWLESLAVLTGLPWDSLTMFSAGSYAVRCFVWVVVLGVLSLWLPNWAKTYNDLAPSWRLSLAVSFMGFMAIGWLDKPQTFLYFQF
jgi:alginate O-acetyltransferase complex protein AlgI